MTISEDFHTAYAGLLELVEEISTGKFPPNVLGEHVYEWRRKNCRDAETLAQGALKTLRYELVKTAMEHGKEAIGEDLGSLGRIEAVLTPPDEGGEAQITVAALPEKLRQIKPEARGFRMGEIQILFEPSEGPPYGHISVSHPSRYPTFSELLRAVHAPGGPPPNLWAWVPKAEDAQNMTPEPGSPLRLAATRVHQIAEGSSGSRSGRTPSAPISRSPQNSLI